MQTWTGLLQEHWDGELAYDQTPPSAARITLCVAQMQGWLAVWQPPPAVAEPPMNGHGEHMGIATVEQIDELRTLRVAQAEERLFS